MRTPHPVVSDSDNSSKAPIGFPKLPTTHQQVRASSSLSVITSFRIFKMVFKRTCQCLSF